jgi:hypothetical protein
VGVSFYRLFKAKGGSVKPKTCVWQYQEDCDYYETECGNGAVFTNGGVKENEYKYCPYCGKKIEVEK